MCKAKEQPLLVMDVEGTDGRERGEDQVRRGSSPTSATSRLTRRMPLHAGLRTEIGTLLSGGIRGPAGQSLGASGVSRLFLNPVR